MQYTDDIRDKIKRALPPSEWGRYGIKIWDKRRFSKTRTHHHGPKAYRTICERLQKETS